MNAATERLLLDLFAAAVRAAQPAVALPPHLPEVPVAGRLIILAGGKAAASMTAAAVGHYLRDDPGAAGRIGGIAVTRRGYACPTGPVRLVEAGHPMPDEAGLEGTREVLRLAASATAADHVLVLLSGGASANWIAPAAGIDLAAKQATTRALLRSGAGIAEINTVRRHLSLIKGGRLARAVHPAALTTLAISDVPGDQPAAIGSGPTVPDPTTLADARAVIGRYHLDLPPAILAALDDPAAETPKPGDPAFAGSTYRIVARPLGSLEAAAAVAAAAGYRPVILGDAIEGEARDVAAAHAGLARRHADAGDRVALLSGGELTVTITGGGSGGPNQEYALALAIAIAGDHRLAAIAADTDGTDGGGGLASDPAGALVDGGTAERAMADGHDAAAFLANNDSTSFFSLTGGLVRPGPTLTNVNDFRAILVDIAKPAAS